MTTATTEKMNEDMSEAETAIRTNPALANPVSIGILFLAVVALVFVLHVGKDVALPITMAIILKLLLKPLMDFLQFKLRFPAPLAALILILCLFSTIATIGVTISGPASGWINKAPTVLPAIKEKLVIFRRPIDYLQGTFKELEEVAAPQNDTAVPTVAVKDTTQVVTKIAWATVAVVTIIFTTMIVLFFLLAAGDRLLVGLIEVLPSFSDKRQAVDIATEIQRQIGGYLLTITLMNSVVGVLTGVAMWACGLGDPILWGSAAFILNYIPILGPVAGIGMFLLAGIVSLDWPLYALLPAGIYLLIHIAEGEMFTPMLLAKRFTLNPVIVITSLFFWYAVWGAPGALLAVPLLAMLKIICDRIETLKPAGHIIGA